MTEDFRTRNQAEWRNQRYVVESFSGRFVDYETLTKPRVLKGSGAHSHGYLCLRCGRVLAEPYFRYTAHRGKGRENVNLCEGCALTLNIATLTKMEDPARVKSLGQCRNCNQGEASRIELLWQDEQECDDCHCRARTVEVCSYCDRVSCDDCCALSHWRHS